MRAIKLEFPRDLLRITVPPYLRATFLSERIMGMFLFTQGRIRKLSLDEHGNRSKVLVIIKQLNVVIYDLYRLAL